MTGAKKTPSSMQVKLPKPHPGQQAIRSQMKRFNWLSAGRRWRKTTLCLAIIVEDLLAGKKDIWGAPTYKQAMVAFDEMKTAAAGAFEFNLSDKWCRSPNGGEILYMSLDDPENARGRTVTGHVFLDEIADIPRDAWHAVLRPMLMDSNSGLIGLGTPKGQNWFYEEWVKAFDRDDSAAWQIPTKGAEIVDGRLIRRPHPYENPDIPWDEIKQMFDTMPEQLFRQEILAEFIKGSGSVFRGITSCIRGEVENGPTHGATQYGIGVDLAKYQDYTVCVVIDVVKRQVVDFQRWNLADWPLQKARLIALAEKWNRARVLLDGTGIGDPIYDDLERAGLRIEKYVFTNNSKRELLEKLALSLEQEYIHFPDIKVLRQELEVMQYERTPSGNLRMNAPAGMHDDCVMALGLANWLLLAPNAVGISSAAIEALRTSYTDLNAGKLLKKVF